MVPTPAAIIVDVYQTLNYTLVTILLLLNCSIAPLPTVQIVI